MHYLQLAIALTALSLVPAMALACGEKKETGNNEPKLIARCPELPPTADPKRDSAKRELQTALESGDETALASALKRYLATQSEDLKPVTVWKRPRPVRERRFLKP